MEKLAKRSWQCDDGSIYIYRGEASDFAKLYFKYDLLVRTLPQGQFDRIFESAWEIYDEPEGYVDIDNIPKILRIMASTIAIIFRI